MCLAMDCWISDCCGGIHVRKESRVQSTLNTGRTPCVACGVSCSVRPAPYASSVILCPGATAREDVCSESSDKSACFMRHVVVTWNTVTVT
jgi:hypothetical protein